MAQDENKKALPDDKEMKEFIKDYNRETRGEETTRKEISEANHQARNDYQNDGEPFGPLSNRDVNEKQDIPTKTEK